MNKTVWKFPIKESLVMPAHSNVIRVGHQNGEPFLWACVLEGEQEQEVRSFKIYGTGHSIPLMAAYVGSFTMENNGVYLEWHVWEVP